MLIDRTELYTAEALLFVAYFTGKLSATHRSKAERLNLLLLLLYIFIGLEFHLRLPGLIRLDHLGLDLSLNFLRHLQLRLKLELLKI